MEGKRFIRSLRLQNFLSYGNEEEEIELQPLNILIGPNASGKSNLIEALKKFYAQGFKENSIPKNVNFIVAVSTTETQKEYFFQ